MGVQEELKRLQGLKRERERERIAAIWTQKPKDSLADSMAKLRAPTALPMPRRAVDLPKKEIIFPVKAKQEKMRASNQRVENLISQRGALVRAVKNKQYASLAEAEAAMGFGSLQGLNQRVKVASSDYEAARKTPTDMRAYVERVAYLKDPSRRLSREEQQEAKEIAAAYQADLRRLPLAQKRTKEDLQRMADVAALEAKYKGGTQFGLGLLKSFGAEAANKKVEQALPNFVRDAVPSAPNLYQSAQKQAPIASGAGLLVGEGVKYVSAAKALGAIPKVGEALRSGSMVKRIAAASAVDLPMDLASAALYSDGDKKEFGKQLGINVAFGVGAGTGIELIGKGIRSAKAAKAARASDAAAVDAAAPVPTGAGGLAGGAVEPDVIKAAQQQRFSDQIDAAMREELEPRSKIVIGDTPAILQQFGAQPLTLTLDYSNIRKIAYPDGYMRGKHNLGFFALKNLPKQLENPVAILKSATQRDSLVVFTEFLDNGGNPVMVPIHLNKDGRIGISNEVASMYGRKGFEKFVAEQRKLGNILYENKEKGLQALPASGLQLSRVGEEADPMLRSIPRADANIKPNSAEVSGAYGGNTVGAAEAAIRPEQRVSKVRSNTIENSPMFSEADKAMMKTDEFTYDVVSERKSVAAAKGRLVNDFDGEVIDLPTKNDFSGEDLDTSMGIIETFQSEARRTGDYFAVTKWAKLIAEKGTQGGQFIQAFAKYSRTPEGAIVKASRVVEAVEREMKEKSPNIFGAIDESTKKIRDLIKAGDFTAADIEQALASIKNKKTRKLTTKEIVEAANAGKSSLDEIREIIKVKYGVPTISNADTKAILDNMTEAQQLPLGSYERTVFESRAEQIIADKVPATFREKFRGMQRIFMLLNPLSWVRNPVGNAVLGAVENIKDVPGTWIDMAIGLKTGERTTSVSLKNAPEQMKGAAKGVLEWGKDIRYKVDTSPSRSHLELPNKRIFKNEFLNALDQFGRKVLQFGDRPFYQASYHGRLAELKRLGKTGEEAEIAARLFALDRVFQNSSTLSKVAMNVRKEFGIFGDLIVPFAQTPANILDKLLDYSPVGFGKAMCQLGMAAKHGAFDQKLFVDRFARSLTGAGIMVFGGVMAAKGLAKGRLDKNKDVRAAQYAAGENAYSFKFGDIYYSFSWAQPIAGLLSAGVDAYHATKDKEGFLNVVAAGAEASINTVFSQSFLQGVFSLLSGYSPAVGIGKALLGSTSQATPSVLAALTKTIDPYVRETYDPNLVAQQGKKLAARLPLLSTTLPQKIDAFGAPVLQSQGRGISARAFENFLNPGKITMLQHKDVYGELNRLYAQTGDSKVFPIAPEKKFKVKGKTVSLSSEDYETFARSQGEIVGKNIRKLIQSKEYAKLSDEQKSDSIDSLYAYARSVARSNVSDYQLSDSEQKIQDAEKQGILPAQYSIAYSAQKDIEADKDKAGEPISGTGKVNKREAIDKASPNMLFSKREILYQAMGVGLTEAEEKNWGNQEVRDAVGSKENYYKIQELVSTIKADKDEYGRSISGTAKEKEVAAIAKTLQVSTQKAREVYTKTITYKYDLKELSSKDQEAFQALSKDRMSEKSFIKYRNAIRTAQGIKGANGKTISGSLKNAKYQKLVNAGLSPAQARRFLTVLDGSKW